MSLEEFENRFAPDSDEDGRAPNRGDLNTTLEVCVQPHACVCGCVCGGVCGRGSMIDG